MDEAKAQPNNQSTPPGRGNAALLCHSCPCTVSVLTQAFHFHASLFITRQTIPARGVQGKNNALSLVWLSLPLSLPLSSPGSFAVCLFHQQLLCYMPLQITNLNNECMSE